MRRRLRLNENQRELSYGLAHKYYLQTAHLNNDEARVNEIERLCREDLKHKYSSIIATILISLAIKIIVALIWEWIKTKLESPPMLMPGGFGATESIEVDE